MTTPYRLPHPYDAECRCAVCAPITAQLDRLEEIMAERRLK